MSEEWAEAGPGSHFISEGTIMSRSSIISSAVSAGLIAALAATMANGAPSRSSSSPEEKAATAALNRKIMGDNAAEEARARTRQEAYDQQVKQQQTQYDGEQKRIYEQQKAYDQQVNQQRVQYEAQIRTYEQQRSQYEEQVKNAQFNTEKQQPPPQ
jgi:hypothetical protein